MLQAETPVGTTLAACFCSIDIQTFQRPWRKWSCLSCCRTSL